ncbi:hypothetical protein M5E89_05640 [Acidaminococcus intestini]|nr:hypothetical protein M5E89_05640 [Acidaminococcus intestini]
MSKIAFMFPGQGSQKVGMMKDLYDNYSVVKDVFKEADEALGFFHDGPLLQRPGRTAAPDL